MQEDQIERYARKAGMTPREYCLSKIDQWKENLQAVSNDYRGLDDEAFDNLVEREIDSRRGENESDTY